MLIRRQIPFFIALAVLAFGPAFAAAIILINIAPEIIVAQAVERAGR